MEWFTQTSGAPGGGGMGQMLIFMVPVFIIMYVLMIRPQKLKEKKRKEMLSQIKKNDHVVTIGGIYGTVVTVKEKEVILKIEESNNMKLKLNRSAVARILSDGDDGEDEG